MSQKAERSAYKPSAPSADRPCLPWPWRIPRRSVYVSGCSTNEVGYRRPFKYGSDPHFRGSTLLRQSRVASNRNRSTLAKAIMRRAGASNHDCNWRKPNETNPDDPSGLWPRVRLARTGKRRAAETSGAGVRSIGGRRARLFLRRRHLRRRSRQGDHAGPDLRGGGGAEGRPPAVSARAYPWRRADRHKLDGNAGRAQGLDRLFRRTGLYRLHDRPADARPLRLAPG